MKLVTISCVVCLWLASESLPAQEVSNAPRHDPIAEFVLPPELIMQHQKTIDLSDAQETAVIAGDAAPRR